MPNWCFNTLTVSGPEDAVARFHSDRQHALKHYECDAEQVITFNQVAPIPTELKGTISPTPPTEEQIRQLAKDNNWSEEILQDRLSGNVLTSIQDTMNKVLIQKYGVCNWYDWCISNWNTKWDACHAELVEPNQIKFDTAWGPPTKVIREFASGYPELTFTHSYSLECEEGWWLFTYFTEEDTLMVEWEYETKSFEAIPADELDEHAIP